jgi:hypothetical protein
MNAYSRDVLVDQTQGQRIEADGPAPAEMTYFVKGHASSADETLRDLIVPPCFHVTLPR